MKKFSRILVALFGLLIWQSSLGTTAARIYDQKLLQNGYRMYEDGFMIQWGKGNNSTKGNMTVYLPVSFFDTTYCLVTTMETVSDEQSVYGALPYIKSKSYFSVRRRYATAADCGDSARGFDWVAVGRWK